MKKILFVVTPVIPFSLINEKPDTKISYYIPKPNGLCYLGGVFRQNGFDVEIYDPMLLYYNKEYTAVENRDILKEHILIDLKNKSFDYAGISCPYIYTYKWTHYFAESIKKSNPNVPVLCGNGYPTLLRQKVLKDPNIDYAIIGEGEVSTLQLIKALEENSLPAIEKIDGIVFRKNGQVIVNEKVEFIQDLDALPFPAWDLVDYEKYMEVDGKRTLIIQATRGCPYSCTFCSSFELWGRKFRKRSFGSIVQEIDYLSTHFRVQNINFIDDNLSLDKELLIQLSEELGRRKLTWELANVSSFTIDKEVLLSMKNNYCTSVTIAVESASRRVLKAIKKPVDLEKTKQIVKWSREIGLPVVLLYITGMPYEKKEDIIETLRFSKEVKGDWNTYSTLVPFPGTEIYDTCIEKGYIDEETLDFEVLNYQNRGLFSTENWDLEWVKKTTYDFNIMTNFINNYNISEKDGNLEYIIQEFRKVYSYHKLHIIAGICLAYALDLAGMTEKANGIYVEIVHKLDLEEVKRAYGKYLGLNKFPAIRKFNEFRENYPEIH